MQDRDSTLDDVQTLDGVQLRIENGRARIVEGKAEEVKPANFIPLTAVLSASAVPTTALHPAPAPRLDLETVRARLAGKGGQQYWRSLEELAATDGFQELLEREFPRQAPRDMEPLARRDFLKLMGAALALAGVSGCAYQPTEKIVPYVQQPEEIVPGKPLFYATSMTMGGYAYGALAENHMGRPTKIEGNPDHPATLGATDPFMQASLLTMYDPDRSQTVRQLGNISTWDSFLATMQDALAAQRPTRGAGIRILTETVTSPTLTSQLRDFTRLYPGARWHTYEPASLENAHAGSRLAFGADVNTLYRFDQADVILSLDSNFLQEEAGRVRYAREFINGRRVRQGRTKMNRLYVAESTPTITGAMADHRLPVRAGDIEGFARAIARQVGVAGVTGGAPAGTTAGTAGAGEVTPAKWISAVAADLQASRGRGLVLAGPHQPPAVHALAHAINQTLGNAGKTVIHTEPVETSPPNHTASLRNLVNDMRAGKVKMLLILGGNPVYNAPADFKFAQALNGVPLRIHLGLYDDETSALCHWHIPESHYLETWSDARAFDGTVSLVQPLIRPLYDSRSAHEVLSLMLGNPTPLTSYDIVRSYWQGRRGLDGGGAATTRRTGAGGATFGGGAMTSGAGRVGTASRQAADAFEKFWEKALHDGVVPNTKAKPRAVALRTGFIASSPSPTAGSGLEVVFRPDPSVWDGRYANNAWLQELPKPITKLTWDNAALMSAHTAQQRGLNSNDVVELTYRGSTVRAPILVVPGHPDNSVTVHLGYGRTRAGKVGTGTGFNAYALRTSDAPGIASGVEMRKTSERYQLVTTQQHFLLDARSKDDPSKIDTTYGRDIVRVGAISEFVKDPRFLEEEHEEGERMSLFTPEWPSDVRQKGHKAAGRNAQEGGYEGYGENHGKMIAPHQWGMAIDLNACIGCNACTVGCQSENNIATVGKDQVSNSREMHWLRIDTYFKGYPENPEIYFQPMLCQHCEKAPCEPVCPVEATSHSAEGINEMTYNRCVGTRYCSNNCPYKVRRFNFLQYSDQMTPVIKLMKNPDVTVRSRGVMEKCTYCVQRVNLARIEAEKEFQDGTRPNAMIRDGEIVTACQQACPTDAIIFGNINDPKSLVSRLKREPHNYGVLKELNTEPRTSYLARLRNPNPALEPPEAAGRGGDGGEGAHFEAGPNEPGQESGERKEH
jgi:MoCo/4Fe-4S cofactor protein with predicted Tat translocation signal